MAKNEKHVFRAQDLQQPSATRQDGKTVFRAGNGSGHSKGEAAAESAGRRIRRKEEPSYRQANAGQKNIRNEIKAQAGQQEELFSQEMPVGAYLHHPKRKKRKNRKKLVGLAAVCGVAVLLIGLAVWSFTEKKDRPKEDSPAQSGSLAAAPSQDGEWPAQVGDRLVDAKPQALVSLSPMITRVLLSLPGHEVLKGVTEYCSTEGADIPTVGTPLLPRPDEIAPLHANYVLCQTPLTENVKTQIEQSGARVIQLTTPTDMASFREFYGQLGAIMLGNVTGRSIGTAVIDRLQDNLTRYKSATGGSYTALVLPDLSGMAVTEDTAEWALLGQVFRHPLQGRTNWLADAECLADEDAENDLSEIIAADPDVLFLPSDLDKEEAAAALGEMRAVKENKIIYYERQMMENLSPMLIFDVAKAAQLVCPEGAYRPEQAELP